MRCGLCRGGLGALFVFQLLVLFYLNSKMIQQILQEAEAEVRARISAR